VTVLITFGRFVQSRTLCPLFPHLRHKLLLSIDDAHLAAMWPISRHLKHLVSAFLALILHIDHAILTLPTWSILSAVESGKLIVAH